MYRTNSAHICSRAVLSKNLNPASVTPSFSPLDASPIKPAARNRAPTSRSAAFAPAAALPFLPPPAPFFFAIADPPRSPSLTTNASLAPVSVNSSASHRPFAYDSRSSGDGSALPRSLAVAASSSSNPSPNPPPSMMERIPR